METALILPSPGSVVRRKSLAKHGQPVPALPILDFRRAAAWGAAALAEQFTQAEKALSAGCTVHALWPACQTINRLRLDDGRCLVSAFLRLVQNATAEVVIHLRCGQPAPWLAQRPLSNVTLKFYVNGEDAALRWEREDCRPAQRIRAAKLLKDAGWQVSITAGPLRSCEDFKADLSDLSDCLAAAGFTAIRVSFGLDSVWNTGATDGGFDGLRPHVNASGVSFRVPSRVQRQILGAFKSNGIQIISDATRPAAADFFSIAA